MLWKRVLQPENMQTKYLRGNWRWNCNMHKQTEIWLSVKEVAELLEISNRHLRRLIDKFCYKTISVQGGKSYAILLSSLPEHAQIAYYRKLQSKDENLMPEKLPLKEKHISEKAQEIALAKYELVIEWKKYRDTSNLKKSEADKKFEVRYNKLNQFPEIFKKLGKVSIKSLYRWSDKLKKSNWNYELLVPGYGHEKSRTKVSKKEAEILIKNILHPNELKISEIIRMGMEEMEIEGCLNNSEKTYRRWINRWKQQNYDKWLLCRGGQKMLNDKNLPDILRDKSKLELGDLLEIDGHVMNMETLNPFTGKPKRMILVLVYDYATDIPLGWELMPTENIYSITSALRRAIIRLGFKPRYIQIDNGRANKSKWFMGDMTGLRGLFYKVADGVTIAKPYHGQSKTMERFFGTMAEAERMALTYSGTSIAKKPPRMMRNEKFHKKLYERFTSGIAMTIEETHLLLADWFDKYMDRKHQDGFYKGKTPRELVIESYKRVSAMEDFSRRVISEKELNYLMMPREITTLYKNGIRHLGNWYYNSELYSLEKGEGKADLIIKYDWFNKDSILVYKKSGEFICEAYKRELTHPLARLMGTEEDILKLERQLEEKGMLEKSTLLSAKEHFDRDIRDSLPATMKIMEIKEAKRITEKEKNIVKKAREIENRYDDLDFGIDYYDRQNEDDEPDFSIANG
jgi:putative transposase